MSNSVDFDGRPFHFIGVGGIGMSALAYVLANRQLPVSGSDQRPNHITKRLASIGVNIFDRQEASNLQFFRSLIPTNEVCLKKQEEIPNVEQTIMQQVDCSTAINNKN